MQVGYSLLFFLTFTKGILQLVGKKGTSLPVFLVASMEEHRLIIFMLALIWGAYQRTLADSAYNRMVKERVLNTVYY